MAAEPPIGPPRRIGPYVLKDSIGQGATAIVYMAQHEDTHRSCVCKVVPRARLGNPSVMALFEQEMRINRHLDHPGIVKFYDLLSDAQNFYVIMELCPNGDLYEHVVQNGRLSECEAKIFFRQILEALSYLHSRGVSHRDIKLENLLIDQFGRVKISDFGLSNFMKDGLVETPCGSPCYASPECLSGEPYGGAATDVWSAGVVLFAMVTGRLPWTKRNQIDLFQQIRAGEYSIPDHVSMACRSLISSLMAVDPKNRITIEDALDHPWMAGIPQQFRVAPQTELTVGLRSLSNTSLKVPKVVTPTRRTPKSQSVGPAGITMEAAASEVTQRRSSLQVRRRLVQPRMQAKVAGRVLAKRPNIVKAGMI